MEAIALRVIALAVCVVALAAGAYAAGRATADDKGRDAPRALAAPHPAPVAPRLPPAVGVPQLKYDQPGQTFTP